jgi:hypothetical protein
MVLYYSPGYLCTVWVQLSWWLVRIRHFVCNYCSLVYKVCNYSSLVYQVCNYCSLVYKVGNSCWQNLLKKPLFGMFLWLFCTNVLFSPTTNLIEPKQCINIQVSNTIPLLLLVLFFSKDSVSRNYLLCRPVNSNYILGRPVKSNYILCRPVNSNYILCRPVNSNYILGRPANKN